MTDRDVADKVYIEPITLEFVSSILRRERPDAIVPTLGVRLASIWPLSWLRPVYLMSLASSCSAPSSRPSRRPKTVIFQAAHG